MVFSDKLYYFLLLIAVGSQGESVNGAAEGLESDDVSQELGILERGNIERFM